MAKSVIFIICLILVAAVFCLTVTLLVGHYRADILWAGDGAGVYDVSINGLKLTSLPVCVTGLMLSLGLVMVAWMTRPTKDQK